MSGPRPLLALHGAFRGGWYWEPLSQQLVDEFTVWAPDLDGPTLDDWIRCVSDVVVDNDLSDVVVLAHSMGGVVAQALPQELGDRLEQLVLLDSPLIGQGQRPIDVSSATPPDESTLPPRDFQAAPTVMGPDQGFDDPALARWMNDRLRPVPFGPQLDPVPADRWKPATRSLVFCDRTPETYPSSLTRTRCVESGLEHTVIDERHDVAVLRPAAVVDLLAGLLDHT